MTKEVIARRVAVISTSYPSATDDAAGHFVQTEVRRIVSEGCEVTVIAPQSRRSRDQDVARIVEIPHWGAFGPPGALSRLRWRPDRWLGVILFVFLARRALRKFGPFDAGIAHFIVPSFWPICSAFSAPLEIVIHGSDLRLVESLPHFLRSLVLGGLQDAKTTVRCVSRELADRLSRLFHGRLAPRIRVEISPIDVHVELTRSELRKMHGIGPERLVIIAARLVPSKRVDVALQAAALLPGARVVVCGDGPESRRLKKRFPTATFLGKLPRHQMLEWIAAADLLLCASRDEGAPSVVREARTLGIPVVATAAGDLEKWAETDAGLRVVP